ncbi:MFS transporter [Streptomyces sp. NPDC058291]|uniref:MFS transporter n=1 Tax=Streptomyces sp. NPDC058291 TaxID=3346427 RepID=UPI0036E8B22A
MAKVGAPLTPPDWAPATAAIALLTALGVLVVGQMYTVLVLAPIHPMATLLDATTGQVTWTASSFGFAYAAGFLVAGPLTDRYGVQAVMATGLVAATVATAAVSTAPDLGHCAPRRPGTDSCGVRARRVLLHCPPSRTSAALDRPHLCNQPHARRRRPHADRSPGRRGRARMAPGCSSSAPPSWL